MLRSTVKYINVQSTEWTRLDGVGRKVGEADCSTEYRVYGRPFQWSLYRLEQLNTICTPYRPGKLCHHMSEIVWAARQRRLRTQSLVNASDWLGTTWTFDPMLLTFSLKSFCADCTSVSSIPKPLLYSVLSC